MMTNSCDKKEKKSLRKIKKPILHREKKDEVNPN